MKSILSRIPYYIMYGVGLGCWAMIVFSMLTSSKILAIVSGVILGVGFIITTTVLAIREILYWVKKPEPDGWEDDLTNQL